jgi:hypothetical protein
MKLNQFWRLILFLCFILFSVEINAQNVEVFGKVTDSLMTELEFVNLLAVPNEESNSVKFAITDAKGVYKLKLKSYTSYKITISHLGFQKQIINVKTDSTNLKKNIVLIEDKEQLSTVTLNYTPPVIVKQDTIIYKTESFVTGEERKLKDILKKLPAVEVDRDGNVTVQGKKVKKLLVENKEFFTGDSKLAVNNIPADAVDKVEVLDNYNEVAFLKNLEDTDELAMNIKLKENKKKFIFGDIEIGGGVEERYVFHPALYYYSPKTTLNFIGDFNNAGVKSFTVKDYVNFEGGTKSFLEDRESYFNLINDGFSRFLTNRNYTESKNNFGAISFAQQINPKTDLTTYFINSKVTNETKQEFLNEYLSDSNLTENRIITGMQDVDFNIGKLKLTSKKDVNNNIRFNTSIKTYKYNISENILTESSATNNIETNNDNRTIFVVNDIRWDKKYNEKHTISANGQYSYSSASSQTDLLTDSAIFQSILPLEQMDKYSIFKEVSSLSHNILSGIKHYWTINRFNHIYSTFGLKFDFQSYSTNEFQLLENNVRNNFESADFNNDLSLFFGDIFFGLQYKFKRGKFTFKPSLFYHSYLWNFTQFDDDRVANNEQIILPELTADLAFSKTKKLSLKYNYLTRFPSITQLANRLTLINFSSLYVGNVSLKNERIHNIRLRFNNFSLYRDIYYNLMINYRKKGTNIKNETTLEGINSITTPIQLNFEDSFISIGGNITKGLGNVKFSLNSSISVVDYDTPLNSEIINNNSTNFMIGGGFSTKFKNYPNIEINYNKTISKYRSVFDNQFNQNVLSTFLEYDFLNMFILKADYKFEQFINKQQNITNEFNILNASLYMQNPNSAWGFEVSTNNLLDVKFRQRNSLSNILISDERTFILPRIIMLKVTYKL